MARRRSKRPVVPEAGQGLDWLKGQVMKREGYQVNPERPDQVKFEVARQLGVPLQQGYNGHLRTEDAGKIGGEIGGAMVRELVRMAQERLAQNQGQL
jgi:hypothetical protein